MSVPMPISRATLFNAMMPPPPHPEERAQRASRRWQKHNCVPSFETRCCGPLLRMRMRLALRQPRLDQQRLDLDIVLLGEGTVLGGVLVPRQLEELLQVLI